MTNPAQKTAQMISPDAYPQMMGRQDGARAMAALRSGQTMAQAQVAMEEAAAPMKASDRAVTQFTQDTVNGVVQLHESALHQQGERSRRREHFGQGSQVVTGLNRDAPPRPLT